ncbi:MAG: PINc/VapC family ATPase [Nanoarchaeota archaeon]|nr:PINc/VapC family ATPase [Nanoarchaeota archaeon]MBU1030740.1 PINc/VapC family ATPase [Nanoarchaeota archaeon]MBU1849917.1 PINc/VapC family ATPase [Nanoarchaeota archaeon]
MAKTINIIPDTSIIIEGLVSKKIEKKELKPTSIIIHEAVISELEAQANRGRETGQLGLEEIKKLRDISVKYKFEIKFKGTRPGSFEIKYAKSGEIDSLIRELALEEDGTLITADKVQAMVAESKGIKVILYEFPDENEEELVLNKYFDETTMSVHIKENCLIKAKKGRPGDWTYDTISKEVIDSENVKMLAKQITEEAESRKDGFIEISRKGSTIIQLAKYRIVITRPPFADGYEITAVRPVKRLVLKDYSMSEKLLQRLSEHAEGVLISGAPGHGKTTFAQALAEFYFEQNKVVKTIEAPRDLILPDDVTQYSISHGSSREIHDILLLSRPDYTIFDEMRNTEDFRLFADLRLSGVGMVGVIHATKPIDAIQRFIGRIELGVIPHIVDTVVFIKDGQIDSVFSLSMEVKVPSGMFEQDLARPVVTVCDFETQKLEFELYSYGEETVVIPVSKNNSQSPTSALAGQTIKQEFLRFSPDVEVEVLSNHKCVVYIPDNQRAKVIGKNGSNIEQIEKKLGIKIDVRELAKAKKPIGESIEYTSQSHNSNVTFTLPYEYANKDIDVFVESDFTLTVKASKKAVIKINRKNKLGKMIAEAVKYKELIELKRTNQND